MSSIYRPALYEYVLRLADSALILAQRLAEWSAKAPTLEEDVALTNIALDHLGQARALLSYAGELEGAGRSEDDLAFLRDAHEFRNLLLTEQPNGDFAKTIARQFLYDAYSVELYAALQRSRDTTLAAVAAKAVKEVAYHRRHSGAWLVRLGDGSEESHQRMQTALDDLWMYTGELFEMTELDHQLLAGGFAVDLQALRPAWRRSVETTLAQATLRLPDDGWMAAGGKRGVHTEHLGFLLAEMQFLQRAYPGARW